VRVGKVREPMGKGRTSTLHGTKSQKTAIFIVCVNDWLESGKMSDDRENSENTFALAFHSYTELTVHSIDQETWLFYSRCRMNGEIGDS
jgi:hypothetical protein